MKPAVFMALLYRSIKHIDFFDDGRAFMLSRKHYPESNQNQCASRHRNSILP